jgi:hypothetical protein
MNEMHTETIDIADIASVLAGYEDCGDTRVSVSVASPNSSQPLVITKYGIYAAPTNIRESNDRYQAD